MLPIEIFAQPQSPSALVLGVSMNEHTICAVGGQGRDLLLVGRGTTKLEPRTSGGRGLRGALVRGDGEIWVCGEYGHVARSVDGGRSFDKVETGRTSGCLFGVVEDKDGAVWVAGDGGYVARSTDGETLQRVKGVKEDIGRIRSAEVGILIPTDDGHLFVGEGKKIRRTALEAGTMLMAALQTKSGALITVGRGAMFRSEDGGETWGRADFEDLLLCGIAELDDDRLVVVGSAGSILISDDGGVSFEACTQNLQSGYWWCAESFGGGALLGGERSLVALVGDAPELAEAPVIERHVDESDLPEHWRTPAASTARQAWTPAPYPDVENVSGAYVSPWLRAKLYPRRGGIDTQPRPLPTAEEAWAGLRRALFAGDRAGMEAKKRPSGIWERATSENAVRRRLGERILDVEPRAGDLEEDAALVSLSLARYSTFIAQFHHLVFDHLADFLVCTQGLPEACRRALIGLDDELPYVGVGPFGRLRELLVMASDDEYAAAKKVIASVLPEEVAKAEAKRDRDRAADLKWAATFLLPLGPAAGDVERYLLDKAMANVGRFGNFCVHACGLASGDVDTLEAYLAANGKVRHEFFSPFNDRVYLASVIELAGAEAGPVLARMKPASPFDNDAGKNGVWSNLLAHVDSPDARERLLEEHRDGKSWGTAGLQRSYAFDPDAMRKLSGSQEALDVDLKRTPIVRELDDVGDMGDPFPYTPPEARRTGEPLPEGAPAPELTWRREERAAASPLGVHVDRARWNGQPVAFLEGDELEAWLTHRERWALPTGLDALQLAPPASHARLRALGFRVESYWASLVPALLLRGGLDELPALLAALDSGGAFEGALDAAQPVGDVRVGLRVLPAFAGKKHKAAARTWMLRHPAHARFAARLLAESDDKKTREAAARALRFLDPTDTSLDLHLKPKKVKLPAWADAAQLPKVADAAALLEALARSTADEPDPAVALARDPKTTPAFAWALFEAWLNAGAPNKASWAMQSLGFLGDDDCAERLTRLALAWPHEGASARAKAALDALLNLGSERSLELLFEVSQHAGPAGLRKAAGERIEELAVRLDLSADELAERMTPTFGLEDDGNRVYDFGGRALKLVFGPDLEPRFQEEDGRVIPKLPRPNKSDDKAKVKAAKAQLKAFTKATAPLQAEPPARLERLLRSGREIPADVFIAAYAEHPWLKHLAARFVWSDGAPFLTSERKPTGPVHLLHPVEIDEADREALLARFPEDGAPPFPQLDRPVFSRADLERLLGAPVVDEVAVALAERGWHAVHDEGARCFACPFGDVRLTLAGGDARGDLDALSPREVSELAYDLNAAAG
jgi:photosystem II stability/assembly factor-like uncharacterized protein